MTIAQEAVDAKSQELNSFVARLRELITEAIEGESMPMHELEKSVLETLLSMGRTCVKIVLDVLSPGDVGETVELPDGRTVERSDEPHPRPYLSVFGEFKLSRYVYGRGEGRKIELIPLDAHLALPESKFSYLLQGWDQRLATEQSFAQVKDTIEDILGLTQHVDSLERMNRHMAKSAADFMDQQKAPPRREEAAILVQSADGKGVPIRREDDARPIESHRSKSGPKPNRKRMATVGAVYSVDLHVRTPEEVVGALFRDPGQQDNQDEKKRPRPQHKRVRVSLDHTDAQGDEVRGAPAIFGWMADNKEKQAPPFYAGALGGLGWARCHGATPSRDICPCKEKRCLLFTAGAWETWVETCQPRSRTSCDKGPSLQQGALLLPCPERRLKKGGSSFPQ